jgi:hypothetical protein
MPVRTFNYTNRKRILREDARITIREEKDGNLFDAGLSLAHYRLPGEARIFIEAYRQTQYMRFDFGRVGAMHVPDDRLLRDFGSVEGVLFRVKIVKNDDPHGVLLAEADMIRPRKSTDVDENRIPLLPMLPKENMGDEIWCLEFDEKQTLLRINSTLGDCSARARDPVFLALVYPAVFRIILGRILRQEEFCDTDDMDDWRSRWLRFAVSLPGVSDPPSDDDELNIDDWIETAVSAFSRHNNIRATYERYLTGVQEQ